MNPLPNSTSSSSSLGPPQFQGQGPLFQTNLPVLLHGPVIYYTGLGQSDLFHQFYSTMEKIGEGAFSTVLKCRNKYTSRVHACKVLIRNTDSLECIQRLPEFMVSNTVRFHPNVLLTSEIYLNMNSATGILIYELVETDLGEIIQHSRHTLTPPAVRSIMHQLLSGLAYVHGLNIIHCDLKADNVLVNTYRVDTGKKGSIPEIRFQVKIGDFGCAKTGNIRWPFNVDYVATRWYRAPELILTSGYFGHPIDIWSLGCIFYELLMFQALFKGTDERDQIDKIQAVLGPIPMDILHHFSLSAENERRQGTYVTKRSLNIVHMLAQLKQRNGGRITRGNPNRGRFPKRLWDCYPMNLMMVEERSLLAGFLNYDQFKRLTAVNALNHPYFNPLTMPGAQGPSHPQNGNQGLYI